MFKRGFFKVEDIGEIGINSHIYLRGKKRSISKETELVRSMFSSIECTREIILITEGKLDVDAQFAINVFKLAGNGIKEIRITEKEKRNGGSYTTSELKFLDNRSISKLLPHHGLKFSLAWKGVGNRVEIYCHEDLCEPPKHLYDEERRDKIIEKSKLKNIEDFYVFFRKIEYIEIEDKKPEVHVNKDEYEKLSIDKKLGHFLIMGAAWPRTIVYKKGTLFTKNYGIPFPMNRTTFEHFLESRGVDPSRVVYSDDPSYPGFLLSSISIIDKVMKRANIRIDSIYVDGTVKYHASNIDLKNLLLFGPTSAKIGLEKDGKKMVTPVPVDKAISLSYLNSKDIWIRNVAEAYTV